MDKKLCNDGRCKQVRMGEDRHLSHIEKNEKENCGKIKDEKEEKYNFEKKLAILQLKTTIVSLVGSILLSVGSTVVIFGYTLDINASNLTSIGHVYYLAGALMISFGVGLIIGGFIDKKKQIQNL